MVLWPFNDGGRWNRSLQVGLPSGQFGFVVGGCTNFSRVFHFLVCSTMETVGYEEGELLVDALVSRTCVLCGCAVSLRVCHAGSSRVKW